ncbi:hypothetical protein BDK51DRAFT_34096 [Blyttiomyces helicus]|uniref:Uncharacterized protein n=1 Tax=Blyttiomyces helicus TaxID=388810 RepID=A0A4P9W5U1_9FUNG|nr:hypothetical protein BDK51DRAFT_34096 [Blyttiomyces helicus]|eukprot:RKO85476.1 hypothetical protein BDK51DRAFT_34096 [Blyttiomyces helicus]
MPNFSIEPPHSTIYQNQMEPRSRPAINLQRTANRVKSIACRPDVASDTICRAPSIPIYQARVDPCLQPAFPRAGPGLYYPALPRKHVILVLPGQKSSPARGSPAVFICGICDVVPNQPAKPSGKPDAKLTEQQVAVCIPCGKETVILLLRGSQSSLEPERHMTFTCRSCDVATGLNSVSLTEPRPEPLPASVAARLASLPAAKRKKGPVKHRADVVCSACARCVGVGQMQVRTDVPLHEQRRREEWVEPAFEVEVCGGNGPFRTGKWRPRQLFSPGRRTCNVSHERIGAVTYNYESRCCPGEIPPVDRSAMFSIWAECQLLGRGTSKEMEASVEFRTYASIVARCRSSHLEIAHTIGSEPAAGISRLLVLQWEAGKLKAKRRSHPVFSGLFRAVITAATAAHQANYPTSPPLAHFCVALFPVDPDAPDRKQHSHTSNWGGCGFGPFDKYVVGKPIEKSLFDEPGVFPDAVRERQKNWVVAVYELLEWCDLTVALDSGWGVGRGRGRLRCDCDCERSSHVLCT